ncbi:hypothetical protein C8A05DRAFT_19815 [Staphylotrichum tortipilum]|uniref:Uncharacterized protein n=1 Tax=Staphylotrichum tortipilum TaxID=2831512 RepID=A0AAN6MBN1_9PEZI|nr:hypothetical protein C8A05DRAFT_19815 [Staphylotrichum longicolle]
MRISTSSLLAAVAILPGPAYAVKGVISDTVTSSQEGCQSLCGLNNACLMALYQRQCHECWLMDCALKFLPEGLTGAGKDTVEIKPICDSALIPKPREEGCNGAPSTATTTSAAVITTTNSAAGTTETGANGSAAWRMSLSWLSFSVVAAATVLVAV